MSTKIQKGRDADGFVMANNNFKYKIYHTKWETKEDRIRKHLAEFTTGELQDLLDRGKTIYPAESGLDHDIDIADFIEEEIENRREQADLEEARKSNPLWGAFE